MHMACHVPKRLQGTKLLTPLQNPNLEPGLPVAGAEPTLRELTMHQHIRADCVHAIKLKPCHRICNQPCAIVLLLVYYYYYY